MNTTDTTFLRIEHYSDHPEVLHAAQLLVSRLKENQEASGSSKILTFWILGQIALVPMLGMDVSGAAEVEQKAMFLRVELIRALSERKEC